MHLAAPELAARGGPGPGPSWAIGQSSLSAVGCRLSARCCYGFPLNLTRAERWPVGGAPALICVDEAPELALFEYWRITATVVGIFPLLAEQAERLVDEPLAAQQLSGARYFPRPALERFLRQRDLVP